MTRSETRRWAVLAAFWMSTGAALARSTPPKAKRYEPTAAERQHIESRIERVRRLSPTSRQDAPRPRADVAVFPRAAATVLKLGDFYDAKDVATVLHVLDRGEEHAHRLAEGKSAWANARGSIGRGYVSKVDGSIQPYAVIVPDGLELARAKPVRLDVILHGRDGNLSEAPLPREIRRQTHTER